MVGEIVAKHSRSTPLLESTSCGNRPVRRANLSRSVPDTWVTVPLLPNTRTPRAPAPHDASRRELTPEEVRARMARVAPASDLLYGLRLICKPAAFGVTGVAMLAFRRWRDDG